MDVNTQDIKKQLYSNETDESEAFDLVELTLIIDSIKSNENEIGNNEWLIMYIIEKLATFHCLNSTLEDNKQLKIVIHDISKSTTGVKTVS